jgi:hypothetical protein
MKRRVRGVGDEEPGLDDGNPIEASMEVANKGHIVDFGSWLYSQGVLISPVKCSACNLEGLPAHDT